MLIKVVNQREVHPKRSGNAFPYGRQDIETIPKATWREVFCRFAIEVASPGGLSEETKLEKLARASPNNAVSPLWLVKEVTPPGEAVTCVMISSLNNLVQSKNTTRTEAKNTVCQAVKIDSQKILYANQSNFDR
jgi:hypothetical protein